jgi:RNA polymerase sigma-70 factor (ECF subfamily)
MNNSEIKAKLSAIRCRNEAAFAELYHELKTPIFTIINRIVWDKPTAEDVMQEVFLKLYRDLTAAASDSLPSNPRAYIFRTAHNSAIDAARKRAAHPLSLNAPEIENTVHSPIDDLALRMDIDSALKAIPAVDCQIVTLHVIGELKFREIAEITALPLGTVLWRYQKAIGKLRKLLSGGILS